MSRGRQDGWVRQKQRPHNGGWCPGRPTEEHVLSHRDRNHVGDIWVCPECKQVWIAVLRPSMLDAVPHWSVKWKRMCRFRAKAWVQRWENRNK